MAGFDRKKAKQVSEELSCLLADTYVLYLKTQNFHWNLVDPRFFSLHKMFEEQYEELAEAVDLLAERIRALKCHSPGSMKEFLALKNLHESQRTLSGDQMLFQLAKDHQALSDWIRPRVQQIVALGDEATGDIFIERLRVHDKTAWMLRSHLG